MRHLAAPLCACILTAPLAPSVRAETGPGAIVTHDGQVHALRIHGLCAAGPAGEYNIWAVTPDDHEPSVPKEGAPRLHATSNGEWSRLDFYAAGSELTAHVVRDGTGRIRLQDGVLRYDGPADDGLTMLTVELRC